MKVRFISAWCDFWVELYWGWYSHVDAFKWWLERTKCRFVGHDRKWNDGDPCCGHCGKYDGRDGYAWDYGTGKRDTMKEPRMWGTLTNDR